MSYFSEFNWGPWFQGLFTAVVAAVGGVLAAIPAASVLGAQQFTPRQLGILAGAAALSAVGGYLKQSPWPTRAVKVALLAGVHTEEQVKEIMKQTAPGTVPTPETAKAIIADMPKETP